jgi:hypothetical protein
MRQTSPAPQELPADRHAAGRSQAAAPFFGYNHEQFTYHPTGSELTVAITPPDDTVTIFLTM